MVAIGAYLVPTALALLTGGVPLQEGTVAQLRGVTEVSGLVQGYVSAPSSTCHHQQAHGAHVKPTQLWRHGPPSRSPLIA